jgi:hypothetical protein
MELLIAILIHIGLLSTNAPFTMEQVQVLEMQHKQQIDDVKREWGYEDPNTMNSKTVWDQEEL